jgi:hypothetical protein
MYSITRHAFHPLDHQTHRTIRRFEHAMNLCGRANSMNLVSDWALRPPRLRLVDEGDDTIVGERIFDQPDTALLADR